MTPDLRPYQLDALDAIERGATAAASGRHRALVVLPTGTGKTVAFAELIRRRGGRALVLAHRDELLGQARDRLVSAGIDASAIGRVKAGSDEVGARVVVASVQTLARTSRLARLVASCAIAGDFATVVVDEAHHVPAPSYGRILAAVESEATLTTGWTATPGRVGLAKVFGAPVYSRDLIDMIADGWLCDLRGRRVGLDLDTSQLRRSHGEYVEADLARALGEARAPEAVAAAWCRYGEDRPSLVFTAGVRLAHETAAAFEREGIVAEALDATTDPASRAGMLERFRSGATRVLVNCQVLTEGVDLPEVACVVVGRPTLSPIAYSQMIGRGTRLAPGKSDCLVLDVVGASDEHDLSALGAAYVPATLGTIAGLAVRNGASLLDAALADKARRQRLASILGEHGRLVAEDVSLFGRRQLRWLTLPGSRPTYVLGVGDGGHVVLVTEGPATFTVHRLGPNERPELLGSGLPLDAATAVAEQAARSHRASHIARSDARWRSLPATEKQVRFLVSIRRVPADVAATLTRGQASDLLDATIAGRRVEQARREGAIA